MSISRSWSCQTLIVSLLSSFLLQRPRRNLSDDRGQRICTGLPSEPLEATAMPASIVSAAPSITCSSKGSQFSPSRELPPEKTFPRRSMRTHPPASNSSPQSDPVFLLNFLFAGGPPLSEPFPDCGPGTLPADEELGCANPPNCR